jgi:hypothetical protein
VECGRHRANAWRHANKKIVAARRRIYKARNAAKIKRIDKRYRERNRIKIQAADRVQEAFRPKKRSRKYLPTPTRSEPKLCECCKRKPIDWMVLDHCHSTNKFRGWLCNNCNLGFGHFGDTIAGLEKAIAYLRRA